MIGVECPLLAFRTCRNSATMSAHRGKADIPPQGRDFRFDPTATLAVHCGNGFDAGFNPYQSTRLSR
jgi:hypothetical protein